MLEKMITMLGKEVLIVQVDGKVYRGRLSEADDYALSLTDVSETAGGKELNWRTPVVAVPGEGGKHVQIELRELMVPLSSVVRMWLLGEKKGEETEREETKKEEKKEETKKPSPAQYIIRRIGSQ